MLAKLLRQELVEEIAVGQADQAFRSEEEGEFIGLRITDAGLNAIGFPSRAEAAETPARAEKAQETADPRYSTVRAGSKLALLVEQLGRPPGAAMPDMVALLGWQAHTIRAALTGLRRKGFAVTRARNGSGDSVYRASAASITAIRSPGSA